mmetsp:Transcript_11581/g.32809  ORF Transcript_11581/g.32809 Transcript_11581/m.32809 type:complete len:260 (+) Transcript_11581:499-1278(+)
MGTVARPLRQLARIVNGLLVKQSRAELRLDVNQLRFEGGDGRVGFGCVFEGLLELALRHAKLPLAPNQLAVLHLQLLLEIPDLFFQARAVGHERLHVDRRGRALRVNRQGAILANPALDHLRPLQNRRGRAKRAGRPDVVGRSSGVELAVPEHVVALIKHAGCRVRRRLTGFSGFSLEGVVGPAVPAVVRLVGLRIYVISVGVHACGMGTLRTKHVRGRWRAAKARGVWGKAGRCAWTKSRATWERRSPRSAKLGAGRV